MFEADRLLIGDSEDSLESDAINDDRKDRDGEPMPPCVWLQRAIVAAMRQADLDASTCLREELDAEERRRFEEETKKRPLPKLSEMADATGSAQQLMGDSQWLRRRRAQRRSAHGYETRTNPRPNSAYNAHEFVDPQTLRLAGDAAERRNDGTGSEPPSDDQRSVSESETETSDTDYMEGSSVRIGRDVRRTRLQTRLKGGRSQSNGTRAQSSREDSGQDDDDEDEEDDDHDEQTDESDGAELPSTSKATKKLSKCRPVCLKLRFGDLC